ncbi:MAG: hypothetical protein FWC57_03785, partial [Endomicrobia bacterium]|nr:hypothetical protein [Endomicrobiia bacterium]
ILEKPQTCGMQEILDVKKIILAMRKIAEPQQSAYVFYTRANNNIISKEYLAYFRDIFFQCARLNQAIIMRSQTAISLIEVYMSSVTLRLTEIMKFLTIIATVLMPLLIISGYFGMNVKFPEYDLFGERGAWIFAVTLMVSTIAGFLIYFKKKKWF